jgi:medium-chain acyl-[acyl-carrier-protein] hydrolase
MAVTKLANSWLTCFEERPQASRRLLCFAHAGGAASAFATWHRDLPPEIELHAVQLPGRENRRAEACLTNISILMRELLEALRRMHDRPVAVFGHSLGAVIAFEYSRARRRAGLEPPAHLIVSARRAPEGPEERRIAHLPDAALLAEVNRRYNGIPKAIQDDPELLAYFLPILRCDLHLLESHQHAPEPPLTCGITAIGGTDDARASRAELDAWAAYSSGRFETRQFSGGHFFVDAQQKPNVMAYIASRMSA